MSLLNTLFILRCDTSFGRHFKMIIEIHPTVRNDFDRNDFEKLDEIVMIQ